MEKEKWMEVQGQIETLIAEAKRTIEINEEFLKAVKCKTKKSFLSRS